MLDMTYEDTWNTRSSKLTMDYKEYLKSEEWLQIKRKASKRSNYKKCYICASTENLELHHMSYKDLGTTDLRNIRSVCHTCHENIHQYAKRHNVSVRIATNKLKRKYIKANS